MLQCIKLEIQTFYETVKVDKLVKSPKFRHACECRHPELFENTGFPLPTSARPYQRGCMQVIFLNILVSPLLMSGKCSTFF